MERDAGYSYRFMRSSSFSSGHGEFPERFAITGPGGSGRFSRGILHGIPLPTRARRHAQREESQKLVSTCGRTGEPSGHQGTGANGGGRRRWESGSSRSMRAVREARRSRSQRALGRKHLHTLRLKGAEDRHHDGADPGSSFVARSYWQTPLESQFSSVRIDRLLTFEVEPLIKLTPKFPRIVAPAVFAVPPN